ncbi:hypothetical protein C9940_00595 [Pseudidiomarina aestuarii]|uniref:Uncharacterized protein n=1 Tax=Pseudidiomarina aestuarii TaxID=624146 RepID=A0A2T4CZ69_9GAMM|nr:hypothetical protein C9940_00595 [Pseudidiomarina aestuarii]
MIILNKEKELIRLETIEEMYEIPGYVSNLDLKGKKLKSLLADYSFPEKVQCGISSCHTAHNNGYIAETTDGPVTNIGQQCGTKYFGVQFRDMSNRFKRDITEQENRDFLKEFTRGIQSLEKEILAIKNLGKGVTWYNRNNKIILSKTNLPAMLVDKLNLMIKTRTNIVTIDVQLSPEERDAIYSSGARPPAFKSEIITTLSGFNALYPENNLREKLTIEIEEMLKSFKSFDIDLMTFDELKTWSKWARELEKNLNRVQEIINEALMFFQIDNLSPLRNLLTKTDEKHQFQAYLNSL